MGSLVNSFYFCSRGNVSYYPNPLQNFYKVRKFSFKLTFTFELIKFQGYEKESEETNSKKKFPK